MKKFMIFAAVSLLMSSCGVYNKYERPAVDAKGLIRDTISDVDTLVVQDTASFGNLPWRSVFTDAQLRKYIEQGLEKNANLQNAVLTVQMYETMLKAAKLAFLPAINFGSTSMGNIQTLYTDPSQTTKAYTLPVTASWTLDIFGNILSQKRSTQMKMLGAKDYQMAVRAQVVSGVANAYYTLLMLDEQLRIVTEMSGMASRMKNMIPQITDFPNIELLVDNQVLQNQIEKIKPRISATLIKELHNNQIKIEINLAQTEEIAPIKSKKDLFEDMRKNNPAIEQLRQILQLDLA